MKITKKLCVSALSSDLPAYLLKLHDKVASLVVEIKLYRCAYFVMHLVAHLLYLADCSFCKLAQVLPTWMVHQIISSDISIWFDPPRHHIIQFSRL